jgi:hypothetical protein
MRYHAGCRSIELSGRYCGDRTKHQFRRIGARLPVRLVFESLDFLPPAEKRLQLAGAVDDAEYIHPVFHGR